MFSADKWNPPSQALSSANMVEVRRIELLSKEPNTQTSTCVATAYLPLPMVSSLPAGIACDPYLRLHPRQGLTEFCRSSVGYTRMVTEHSRHRTPGRLSSQEHFRFIVSLGHLMERTDAVDVTNNAVRNVVRVYLLADVLRGQRPSPTRSPSTLIPCRNRAPPNCQRT